jgi:hypothetical protein
MNGTCARYSSLLRFWPKDAKELADICTGCGEVARGWEVICFELQCDKVNCTFGGQKKTLDQTRRCCCTSDSLLTYRLKLPPAKKTNCIVILVFSSPFHVYAGSEFLTAILMEIQFFLGRRPCRFVPI